MAKSKSSNKLAFLPFAVVMFLVLTISIGYTAMYANVREGSLTSLDSLKNSDGSVHFSKINNITKIGNVSDSGQNLYSVKILENEYTPSDVTDDKTINFSVLFKKPGDKYQFQVRVVNDSKEKKNVRLTVSPVPNAVSSYIKWNVSGIDTVEGEVLNTGESKLVTISAEYDTNFKTSINKDISVNLSAVVTAE